MSSQPKSDLVASVDISGWLSQLYSELDRGLADLAQTLKSVEEGTYASRVSGQTFGLVRVEFESGAAYAVDAAERAAAGCFRALIASFISFLDKLIAVRRIRQEGIRIVRDLSGYEEAIGYLDTYVRERISETASDRSLTNPKKIELLPFMSDFSKHAARAYFALRRCLEHHQGNAQEDIELRSLKQAVFVDGVEVTSLPFAIKAGQKVELKLVTSLKCFAAGDRVVLTPNDVYAIAFTIRVALAPEAFGARIQLSTGRLEQREPNAHGEEHWTVQYSLAPVMENDKETKD